MSIIDNLITDRTQADVDSIVRLSRVSYADMSAAEKAVWNAGKGAYNITDLNRVEDAVQYLALILNAWYQDVTDYAEDLGVAWKPEYASDPAVGTLVQRTWAVSDIPTAADLDGRYLANVRALATLGTSTAALPAHMMPLTYSAANAIEAFLIAVNDDTARIQAEKFQMLDYIAAGFVYSGEIYGGELDEG